MHRIGVVGLSYRYAGVEDVARFTVPRTEIPARLPALRMAVGAAEILYIGTCNRVEVLYAADGDAPAEDARHMVFRALIGREPLAGEATRTLRAWTGEAAVEHLFLVACGLDPAQAGEQEISAQLRAAWEDSRAAHTCGPLLDRLIGEALAMARQVRRLASGLHTPSLADLAAERVLGHLDGTRERVALIGVSAMTRRCAAILHESKVPLLIVNRSLAPAAELAASVAGVPLMLEDFRARPPALGALVLAAGGGGVLLDGSELVRVRSAARAAPLLVDFGVPPNVDPAAARAAALPRVGMDELIEAARSQRLAQLMHLAPVRAAIDERLAHLRTELALRALGPQLAQLRGTFERLAAEEVSRALTHGLRTLDERQRVELERLARTLAHRLAHLPLAGLKAAAAQASSDALDAFFDAARAVRHERSDAQRELRKDVRSDPHSDARKGTQKT
jgi:glutamyl-tRNA reductase